MSDAAVLHISYVCMTVWSDIENVLNSALSMSLSSLSMSNKAANVLEWIIEDRFNTAKEISYRDT